MRVDLQSSAGESLLVASEDELRSFVSVHDAYRWLQPFVVDAENVSTLRRALAEHVSPTFVSRLSDHDVLMEIAREICRACVAVELPRLPRSLSATDQIDGGPGSHEAPADLVEMAEQESAYEEVLPEPVVPPEFPRLARREADQVNYSARAMGFLLDLLRYIGERLMPESAVGRALLRLARSHAVSVADEASDFGGQLTALAAGGMPRIDPSAVSSAILQAADRTADTVVELAERAGDLLSGLLLAPARPVDASEVGEAMREGAARQGRRVRGAAADAGARLDRLALRPETPPPRDSAVSTAYVVASAEQQRALQRIAELDLELEHLLILPVGWQGPERPAPMPDEPLPASTAGFGVLRISGEEDDESLEALTPGLPVTLRATALDAPAGARVVFSIRAGERGHLTDLFGQVAEVEDPALQSDDGATALPVVVPWSVPSLPPGTEIWFEARYLRGAAVGSSPALPVLATFDFFDGERSASATAPSSIIAPTPAEEVESLIDAVQRAEVRAPRWTAAGDPLVPMRMVQAHRAGSVGLAVDLPGVMDGAVVSFVIQSLDGRMAIIEAQAEGQRALAEWLIPALPPTELVMLVRVDGVGQARSNALPVRDSFPFGDAAPQVPSSRLTPFAPAVLPEPSTSTSHGKINAPRWVSPTDPVSTLRWVPAGRSALTRLLVDVRGVPDGAAASFAVFGDLAREAVATAVTTVEGGQASVELELEPGGASRLRFTARIAGVDDVAVSGPLVRLPDYPFGDGARTDGPAKVLTTFGPHLDDEIPITPTTLPPATGPFWASSSDDRKRLTVHPAGQDLSAHLCLAAPGALDGTTVRFQVDGPGAPVEFAAPVSAGLARAAVEYAAPTSGWLRPTAWLDGRALPGAPLWIAPVFLFGDGQAGGSVSPLRPWSAPAYPPPVGQADSTPVLHAPRWMSLADPEQPIVAVPRAIATEVELRVDVAATFDGTPVEFLVRGASGALDFPDMPRVEARRGIARARWTVPADLDEAALWLFARCLGMSDPVPGAALFVLETFEFGT